MKALKNLVLPGLAILILLSLMGCKDDDPAEPGDVTAPAAVTDLRVESVVGDVVTLAWTAPGDDGDRGTASAYDIRYAGVLVTESNWETCTRATTEPEPAAAGTEQSAVINSGGGADFYFALKTSDEASNWSSLSNVVAAYAEGVFVVRQLTTAGRNDDPHVDDGYVVWVHLNVEGGEDVYIANLESASPTPERLTDNGGEKGHPNNNGSERVVWEGRAGTSEDWELWVYDHLSVPRYSQFTDNTLPDLYPDMAGGGCFAWLQGYTMYESVHYWNESLHSESVISGDCCPTSAWSNEIPSADDYTVVWRSYDRVDSGGPRVWLWNGMLTDITDAIDGIMTIDHSLHAGDIAYEYPPVIKYWDGATVHEIGSGYEPSLYAGTVAYEIFDGHDWEIRYWDGATIHNITDNDFDDMQASLYGSIIVWSGHPGGGVSQIFYVNVSE